MISAVLNIHTSDHSYAGFSASETYSFPCEHLFTSERRAGTLFIDGAGNRHRDNSNFKFNEVNL